MDKKSLLIVIALIMGLSVLAQSMGPEAAPESITSSPLDARYNRPAGAFYCHITSVNGVAEYNSVSNEFIMLKPNSDYTFHALGDIRPETQFRWQCINENGMVFYESYTRDLTVNNEECWQRTPKLRISNGGSSSEYSWYNPSNGMLQIICPIKMLTAVNPSQVSAQDDDIEYLLSSKSPVPHGRNDDGLFCSFDGLLPYGSNGQGWWLGKNASHVDGIAQAFEKPTHPYLLKKVCLMINDDAVITGDVTLTCKVYRLDRIPAYRVQESVCLPEVPGELIALGKGTVTPGTITEKNGLVEFSLYKSDQANLDYALECQLTVDAPILVVIDGYNEPEAAHLVDFTARASTNIMSDEGFGELAYVKCPVEDNEGYFSGDYEWRGLNHLLYDGMTMMSYEHIAGELALHAAVYAVTYLVGAVASGALYYALNRELLEKVSVRLREMLKVVGEYYEYSDVEKQLVLMLYRYLKPLWYIKAENLRKLKDDWTAVRAYLNKTEEYLTKDIDFASYMT